MYIVELYINVENFFFLYDTDWLHTFLFALSQGFKIGVIFAAPWSLLVPV